MSESPLKVFAWLWGVPVALLIAVVVFKRVKPSPPAPGIVAR